VGIATDIKAYFADFRKLLELQKRGASKSYYLETPSLCLIVLHEKWKYKERYLYDLFNGKISNFNLSLLSLCIISINTERSTDKYKLDQYSPIVNLKV
jgi:hypothetical protein